MTVIEATTAVGASAPPLPNFLSPNLECMPVELRQKPNWVPWVPIWTGSKWTKRPIQPSGYAASTTNPKHWSSFEDVKEAYNLALERGHIELRERNKPPRRVAIGGVGFVFDGKPESDGLVHAGVDFDKVIKDGEISSFAEQHVKRLGSYVERSVSGTGLHVIVRARPLESGVTHGGVEAYTSGRFFTMTGRGAAPIIAAPDDFAALVEELRAHGSQSQSIPRHAGRDASEAISTPDTHGWLSKLPPDTQNEAVRHAALSIARNSKLFERTARGGNYQEYLKLTFAIARSGVPDAENIFVEAASTATDADSDEDLRTFFRNCQQANPPATRVKVGTLLHIAGQCGANFDQWKHSADSNDPRTASYVPGKEDECRRLLDRVVAADPQTFTLGDPTGPLVVLRKPADDALPPEARWDSDLPGTTLATSADIMERAERLVWKQRGGGRNSSESKDDSKDYGKGKSDGSGDGERKNRLVRTHPPRPFVNDYLPQMRGRYGARPLRGIVRVPRIDDNGGIHSISGYDIETGLFHDRTPILDIPLAPTRDDAKRMAEVLLLPFSKYQFDDPTAGNALVLAAIFTALERPFLPAAPMFVVRSPMPATGKGKLVRSLVRLAFDTAPVVLTWGGSGEEFEKRLAAVLLNSPPAIMIDNANGMQIQGDLLESIITEGRADLRPLGHSEIVKVRSRSFITLTGNNPVITGDMARRTVRANIQPASADPERVRYGFDPVQVIQRQRVQLLCAAYTAMRAFRLVGMPSQGLPAVGSFDDWARKVRDLVFWITGYDVSEVFRQNKAEDPRRLADTALLTALHQGFGAVPFKAADVIAVHRKVADSQRPNSTIVPTPAELALHDALDDVMGSKGVSAKLFGHVARRLRGAHNGGFVLETTHDPATNANMIVVRSAAAVVTPGIAGITGSFQPLHEDQKNEDVTAY